MIDLPRGAMAGQVYFKPVVASPGEVECCGRCVAFRQENPDVSPSKVATNHLDVHTEWTQIGHLDLDHIHWDAS